MRLFIFLAVFSSSIALVASNYGGAPYSCRWFELYPTEPLLGASCKDEQGNYQYGTVPLGHCLGNQGGHIGCQVK